MMPAAALPAQSVELLAAMERHVREVASSVGEEEEAREKGETRGKERRGGEEREEKEEREKEGRHTCTHLCQGRGGEYKCL